MKWTKLYLLRSAFRCLEELAINHPLAIVVMSQHAIEFVASWMSYANEQDSLDRVERERQEKRR